MTAPLRTAKPADTICAEGDLMTAPLRTSRARRRAVNRRHAASSVAPVASGYERSLRPCLAWFSRPADTICAEGDL
jgi:hypothetical protein